MVTIVKVEWLDITEHTVSSGQKVGPVRCYSYGEIDSQDEETLVLIRERRGEEVDKQAFPCGCIIRITPVGDVND